MSPEQIARALADTAAELKAARQRVDLLQAQQIQLRAMLTEARRLRHAQIGSRLPSRMLSQNEGTREKRIVIADANTHNGSEAKRLLLALNVSDGDVATFLKVGRSTVQAWHAGRNPIPRRHAEAALSEWAVPLSAWPRISD